MSFLDAVWKFLSVDVTVHIVLGAVLLAVAGILLIKALRKSIRKKADALTTR